MTVGYKTGGRRLGSKNKATIERELQAQREIARVNADGPARESALQVMERIAKICEGAAGVCRPTPVQDIEKAAKQGVAIEVNPDGDWERFQSWVTLWGASIRELAKYQHPQIKPVDAPAPPPDPGADQQVTRFTLKVFDGGRALPAPGALPDNAA